MATILGKLNALGLVIVVIILVILFIALAAMFIVRKRYIAISKDLSNESNRERNVYNFKVLNSIVNDYKTAAQGNYNEVNTQAVIERNFSSELRSLYLGERFIKNAVSLMIILGLLGTFYGLTLSIGKLVELLGSTGNVDVLNNMDPIIEGLISSVKGMSVAFVTSLFGIASSVLLTILNIFFNVEEARESVMVEIEEYLDNNVALEISKDKETEYAMLNKALKSTFEILTDRIESSFKYVVDSTSQGLVAVTSEMRESTESLLKSVELFDKSLQVFKENTRDFSEFNYNLRTNIERMNVTFADLTEDLKAYSKDLASIAGKKNL